MQEHVENFQTHELLGVPCPNDPWEIKCAVENGCHTFFSRHIRYMCTTGCFQCAVYNFENKAGAWEQLGASNVRYKTVALERCAIWPGNFFFEAWSWKICSRDLCPTIWPDPDPKNLAKKIDQGTFQMLGTDVHKMCLKPVWPPFCTTYWKHPVVHMHLLCLKPVWHPFCTVHWRHPVVHMHRLYFEHNVWQAFCSGYWKRPVAHVHLLSLQIVWRPLCAAHWIWTTQWRRCTWSAWKKKCGGIQWCTCTCFDFPGIEHACHKFSTRQTAKKRGTGNCNQLLALPCLRFPFVGSHQSSTHKRIRKIVTNRWQPPSSENCWHVGFGWHATLWTNVWNMNIIAILWNWLPCDMLVNRWDMEILRQNKKTILSLQPRAKSWPGLLAKKRCGSISCISCKIRLLQRPYKLFSWFPPPKLQTILPNTYIHPSPFWRRDTH